MSEILESIDAAPVRAEAIASEGENLYLAVCSYGPVDSPEIARIYAAELRDVMERRDLIEAERVKITGPLNVALKAANRHFQRADAPWESIELVLKGHLGLWNIAERKRIEEEQRAAELAASLERERLRQEAAAKEEQARAAAGTTPEQASLLVQEATELRQTAITTIAPVVAAPEKLDGVSFQDHWIAEVESKRSYLEFVGTHPEYDGTVEIKQAAVNGLMRSSKGKLKLPGIAARLKPRTVARVR